MGHSDISRTAEFYLTVDDSMADRALWVVDAVLETTAEKTEPHGDRSMHAD